MSDYLSDSPVVARSWCPGCEPLADPTLEILDVRYCDLHLPSREGQADAEVRTGDYLSGSTEAGGDSNRAWCEVIHQDSPGHAEKKDPQAE